MTLSIKLPSTIEAKLKAEARTRRVPKSRIVRELLEKHYKSSGGKKHRPTFGEVAGHLFGCFDGPPDLSTNSGHMKGYGR